MKNVRSRTRGFTLIELTVVLMILIALAGLLIPMLSGYLERSHAAASSTNIGEINKFVQLYQVKYSKGWPDRADSLLNATNNMPAYIPLPVADFTPATIDTVQANALINGGITIVQVMRPDTDITAGASATFDGVTATPSTLSATSTVMKLSGLGAQLRFGMTADDIAVEDYVVFGLGQNSAVVGKVMSEAPVHFDQADPAKTYSRFMLVYAVPKVGATTTFNARFIGALGSEGASIGEEIQAYHSKDAQ